MSLSSKAGAARRSVEICVLAFLLTLAMSLAQAGSTSREKFRISGFQLLRMY